jgi:hypothetical protein
MERQAPAKEDQAHTSQRTSTARFTLGQEKVTEHLSKAEHAQHLPKVEHAQLLPLAFTDQQINILMAKCRSIPIERRYSFLQVLAQRLQQPFTDEDVRALVQEMT